MTHLVLGLQGHPSVRPPIVIDHRRVQQVHRPKSSESHCRCLMHSLDHRTVPKCCREHQGDDPAVDHHLSLRFQPHKDPGRWAAPQWMVKHFKTFWGEFSRIVKELSKTRSAWSPRLTCSRRLSLSLSFSLSLSLARSLQFHSCGVYEGTCTYGPTGAVPSICPSRGWDGPRHIGLESWRDRSGQSTHYFGWCLSLGEPPDIRHRILLLRCFMCIQSRQPDRSGTWKV